MSRQRCTALFGVLTVVLLLAGCGSGGDTGSSHGPGGKPLNGGTAYFAEQPLSPPNYIFPLISGEYYSVANTADFQTLMYRPLYWYGNDNRSGIDYAASVGDTPRYSDHDRIVTIRLKRTHWSDGELVSARDVGFWINLLKANKDDWASYVPGGFPDNVISWKLGCPAGGQTAGSACSPASTITLYLNRSYSPAWYTGNELSQITPLPLAWDRTSEKGSASTRSLPDTTAAGARAVYRFLNAQAEHLPGYAQSPIWSVVDGAWKLEQLTSSGQATFIPNRRYDGPRKPHLARFVELPFTSEEAEFNVLQAGDAQGGAGAGSSPSSGSQTSAQISVGYVPDVDIAQSGALASQGYRLVKDYEWGFDYFEPNFNNPTVGPILRQLYFRQALQHLVNQQGWIHAYYGGLGLPNYSPVPALPVNQYSNTAAATNPYPYSIAAARRLLSSHGWKVVPNGSTTCANPGDGAGQCGSGITRGKTLDFTLMYPTGLSYTAGAMLNLKSDAAEAGIQIRLQGVTTATIDSEIEPCSAHQSACSWELGQYGQPWVFSPDHYPSGEEIFQSGALGNVGSYSDQTADRLIRATTTAGGGAQHALDAYADYLRKQLPDFWQPSPGTLVTAQHNLGGFSPNAYGFITPEDWYFTR
jgi:peptide/nickel transport system substrate-binding protein